MLLSSTHLKVRVFPRLRQKTVVKEWYAVGVVARLALALILHDGIEGDILHHLHLSRLHHVAKQVTYKVKTRRVRNTTKVMEGRERQSKTNGKQKQKREDKQQRTKDTRRQKEGVSHEIGEKNV